uniref:membrane metallo-endopeptidase-like 1 isoform X2 n=1 Tax=Myxine glutinosa TaxID=7769 RepID=UPI0035902516
MVNGVQHRSKGHSSLELGLMVLLAITTMLLIIFISLYASSSKAPENCSSSECTRAAAQMIRSMDMTVKPCEDFYKYACGGWHHMHVIPEQSPQYSNFDILREQLHIVLKGELETMDESAGEAVKKARMLYRSCMNMTALEERGATPLLKLLEHVGGWPVASESWNESSWNLNTQLAQLNTMYNIREIIDVTVNIDAKDSSTFVLQVDQPILGLPSREYYFEKGDYEKAFDAYLDYMIAMAMIVRMDMNLTENYDFVYKEMEAVVLLETDITAATASMEERVDETELYVPYNVKEMQQNFNISGLNWYDFITNIMTPVNISITPEERVIVYGKDYLERLPGVLGNYTSRTIQNYIVWRVVMNMANDLTQKYMDAGTGFHKAISGVTVMDARWRQCAILVNDYMPTATGSLFVKSSFPEHSKSTVQELISLVLEALDNTLQGVPWMDQDTKAKAHEKAAGIREKIAYQDYIIEPDHKKLDEEHSSVSYVKNMYFENVLASMTCNRWKVLKKLREKVDKDAWFTGAAVLNAFYSPNHNEIVFPAGILQPPYFSVGQPMSLNFGAIGMVIGHEITHGFDDNGRHYDKDGNMVDWWSNSSANNFKENSQCIIDQYGNFTWDLAGGQNLCGINTLGENIADNGGIRQAFTAYKSWLSHHSPEQTLPGLTLSHEQLFFVNFAQVDQLAWSYYGPPVEFQGKM